MSWVSPRPPGNSRRLLRRTAVGAARSPLAGALVAALDRADAGDGDVFGALLYHRVGYPQRPSALDPRLISATPEAFEAQIAYVASHRNALSLDDLLAVRRGRGRLPPRSVIVTFDDGYRDFATLAWPTLRRYGVPAVMFVPTDYPDRPERAFWWDRLHAAISTTSRASLTLSGLTLPLRTTAERGRAREALRRKIEALEHGPAMALVDEIEAELNARPATGAVLGWDELRRLAGEGLALAPHTCTHPLLDRLEPAAAAEEILGSARRLAQELGSTGPAFAYPGGAHSDTVVGSVRRAGFELAFTTRRGRNDVDDCDWLRLRRIHVGARSSLGVVRAQLVGRPRLRRAPGRSTVR